MTGRKRLVSRVTPEMVATMRALRTAGYRNADIAYEVGVTPRCVRDYVRGLPIALHSNRTPASVCPQDPAREERIVAAAKTRTLQKIADQEGVTRERVRQIVVGYMKRTGEVVRRRRSEKKPKSASPVPSLAQRLLKWAALQPETGCWEWRGATIQTRGMVQPRPLIGWTYVRWGVSQIVPRATFGAHHTYVRQPSVRQSVSLGTSSGGATWRRLKRHQCAGSSPTNSATASSSR